MCIPLLPLVLFCIFLYLGISAPDYILFCFIAALTSVVRAQKRAESNSLFVSTNVASEAHCLVPLQCETRRSQHDVRPRGQLGQDV